jgi:hypothetical protein
MKQNLLVGSVHFKSNFWLKYQTSYLQKTTQDYQYVAYLNNVENKSEFNNIDVIGHNDSVAEMHESHCRGIRELIAYFKTTNFDYFLILDSDCFPFKLNWQWQLLYKMAKTGHTTAAVLRFETISDLVHPSAVFLSHSALEKDFFRFNVNNPPDLIGHKFPSVMERSTKFYPLIRTNVWNPHPIFAGIYGTYFYHHGCGSRNVIGSIPYYDITLQQSSNILNAITNQFIADTDGFINKLCNYASVTLL